MKILFISLGCDKNLADSEEMLGLLTANGHEIVDSEEEADAIVINTCCFIHDAKEESVNTILEMAEYKKSGTCKVLIVTGCMAQRYQSRKSYRKFRKLMPYLEQRPMDEIVKALDELQAGQVFLQECPRTINELPGRLRHGRVSHHRRTFRHTSRLPKAVISTVLTALFRSLRGKLPQRTNGRTAF